MAALAVFLWLQARCWWQHCRSALADPGSVRHEQNTTDVNVVYLCQPGAVPQVPAAQHRFGFYLIETSYEGNIYKINKDLPTFIFIYIYLFTFL